DVTPDPFAALEQLIDLGFRRVMTSGQEESVYNGTTLIAELIRRSAGRIEVLPAGGINRFTVADVVARTGCVQVHASLRTRREGLAVVVQVIEPQPVPLDEQELPGDAGAGRRLERQVAEQILLRILDLVRCRLLVADAVQFFEELLLDPREVLRVGADVARE